MSPRVSVYLSIGSNIEPEKHLPLAVQRLRQLLHVVAVGSTWQTPPYGTSGQDFYNSATHVMTEFKPEDLKMKVLRPLESELGRVRTSDKYAPRTIDLDIVIYNVQVLESRLWNLPFLAIPMADLLPGLVNPSTGQTLAQIASEMLANYPVFRRPEVTL